MYAMYIRIAKYFMRFADLWTSLNDTHYAEDLFMRSARQIQFKCGLNVWMMCNKYFSLRKLISIIKSYIKEKTYKSRKFCGLVDAEHTCGPLKNKIGKSNQNLTILSYLLEFFSKRILMMMESLTLTTYT